MKTVWQDTFTELNPYLYDKKITDKCSVETGNMPINSVPKYSIVNTLYGNEEMN